MDRILTRLDHEGNPVIFLPDSYKNGKLLAWYGQSNAEPVEVSIDYYRLTKDLEKEKGEAESARLKMQFEKVLANGPVMLMHRFPRGFMKALKEVSQKAKPKNKVTAAPIKSAEKAHYDSVRAVRAGRSMWKLVDDKGETLEIVASEQEAVHALERRSDKHATVTH